MIAPIRELGIIQASSTKDFIFLGFFLVLFFLKLYSLKSSFYASVLLCN